MRNARRLEILSDWAEDRGYVVELDRDEACSVHPGPRVIVVTRAQSRQSAVYAMLHECGHVLQLSARPKVRGFLFADPSDVAGSRGAWGLFERELDAWRRGWFLGQSLGLGVSERGFEAEAYRCLRTYIPR